MGSKIQAARVAARGGVNCCVANGMDIHNISRVRPPPPPRTDWTRRVPHPVLIGHAASLSQVFGGEDVGTLFPAHQRPTKFQHWLLFSSQPKGSVILCDGVTQARAAPPAAPPPRRPAA